MELTEYLCEFVGAIIGDGCISKSSKKNGNLLYQISFTGDSVLDREYFEKDLGYL